MNWDKSFILRELHVFADKNGITLGKVYNDDTLFATAKLHVVTLWSIEQFKQSESPEWGLNRLR